MIRLITILLLIISTNIYSQQTIYFDKDWKETDKMNALYYRQIHPSNNKFIVKDYLMDDKLQFDGVSSTAKEPLILEGEAIWYNENGIVTQKGNFKNNTLNGKLITYYLNGKIKSTETYENGKLEGLYTEFFPTGEISNQAVFSKNQINGLHNKYRSPNQLEFKVNYKNGVIDGAYEFYNSNETLFNKGSAKDGIQNGKCFDYYYEGELRKEYTIKEGLVDGELIEYDRNGNIMTKGLFDMGKVISFESISLRTTNNSTFSSSMKLKNGIEEWKVYRDGKLILKSFYKDGFKTGKWEVFNYDGSKLYQILNFDDNTDCKDTYLQRTKEEFDPFLFLSSRFNFESKMIDIDDCNGGKKELFSNESENPFYYLKEKNKKTSEQNTIAENKNLIDYKESANDKNFLVKNNCIKHPKYNEVHLCIKEINSITHKVFLSENLKLLKELRSQAKPKDNEIYFYYQKFEERIYDLDKEHSNRYMGFKLPDVLVEAFKNKTLDYISVIGVYEHQFWNIDNFSGSSAYFAFKKEIAN
ncbi:hypothetical protein [Olleya sp.]|uniref:toxin-antitoxin system YwqK family antitoxin n=1 Tax=Olleya sp. TaxID=1906788 RepID=UPI0032D96D8E